LTDPIGLGVLSARFLRDLIENAINRTGVGRSVAVDCQRT